MSDKIKTFSVRLDDTELITENIDDVVTELKNAMNDVNDDEDHTEFTITIERKYTREEYESMPDFNGF